jgi:disulfide bond formation protein DsbB
MSRALPTPSPLLWCLIAIVASLAMLGGAHSFETFGGYAPCGLCLRQREVYWAALTAGLIGAGVTRKVPSAGPVIALILTAIFAAGLIVAAFHAGVEWKWWPGPTSCSGATGTVDASAMTDLLNGAKVRPPACDEAAWRMFGISMAGYNALISAGLVALGAVATFGGRRAAA